MKRRLRRLFNLIFPWYELVRRGETIRRAVHQGELQAQELDRIAAFVRDLEDKNDKLVETQHESARQLRASSQRIADLSQKVVELTERESAALNKLTTAIMQVANFQAFVRGIKIPIFPGVGPDLPEPKPLDYEKLARQMPRSTRQAEILNRADFMKSFSAHLEEEAEQAEQAARQE